MRSSKTRLAGEDAGIAEVAHEVCLSQLRTTLMTGVLTEGLA